MYYTYEYVPRGGGGGLLINKAWGEYVTGAPQKLKPPFFLKIILQLCPKNVSIAVPL